MKKTMEMTNKLNISEKHKIGGLMEYPKIFLELLKGHLLMSGVENESYSCAF
jgi:hypothetical protein